MKITATDTIKFEGISAAESLVEERAVGNAGGVEISTKSLELLGDSRLNANTFGQGNAGNVKITATDTVKFDGKSGVSSQVALKAVGNAGGVEISTKSLELLNGSYFSASTFGKGNAGSVKITATDTVKFEGNSAAESGVVEGAVGNAGGLEISTKSLELLGESRLNANTFGKGDAGIIKITTKNLNIQGRGAGITASTTDKGNGGSIIINADEVNITNVNRFNISNADGINIDNLAGIAALTTSQGNSGNIIINASKEININGNSLLTVETTSTGNAGNIEITTPQLKIQNAANVSAATSGSGKGGNIQINANDFKTESGGKLITTTSAVGQAGTIILKIKDNLYLTGEDTGIFANTKKGSTGAGGSIDIDPITMLIENGASIKVDSQGTGIAGNIKIEAGNLTLNNRGTISAETFGGEGGNITLNVAKDIRLRNNSLISAEAGNAGNGGNININAGGFVLAFLNENSDIVANAFAGTGGTVTGKAVGIFGFRQFIKERTPESDFIASSKLGIDGIVSIETNQQNLPQVSPDFINIESLNKNVCAIKDDKIAGGNSFTITGKGGLPLDSYELISNSPAFVEWENNSEVVTQVSNSPVKVTQKNTNHPQKIQQAQGWIIGENGKVILTADSQKITLQTDKNNLPDCK
ncbi:S-layer family protein [Anabaena sp. UHCC 0253]|nr:S-layer family protein [Anabaena sp. UHCC 0253]